MKNIAVDFDETISDNIPGWLSIMNIMKRVGYNVLIVTYREEEDSKDLQFLLDYGYKIFYTAGIAKKGYMDCLGIDIAIWVDDKPEKIYKSKGSYK